MAEKSGANSPIRKKDIDGNIVLTEYEVFPGIYLQQRQAQRRRLKVEPEESRSIFEISHCREGRIELGHEQDFYYLAPGDLSIVRRSWHSNNYYFPQGYYSGITVVMDLDKTPENLSMLMGDIDIRPAEIIDKFCADKDFFIARSNASIDHVFSELYSVPETIKSGYYKVKVLELLLFLSEMNTSVRQEKHQHFTRSQVLLAKGVCEYMTQNMDKHITIERLAELFHISGTQLKNTFKGVYGISIYSYIRSQKMQAAGRMLRESDETVLEIAGKFGYENGSKFAKAFRAEMGMSPKVYRTASESKIKSVFLE